MRTPDREKVITTLTRCVDCQCMDCHVPGNSGYPWDCSAFDDTVRDAIALLKKEMPRVMTLKEVETFEGFVWAEFHSTPENRLSLEYVNVRATEHFPDSFTLTTDSGIAWIRDRGDYNTGVWYGMNSGWRCWTSRPTEEQREAVEWNG